MTVTGAPGDGLTIELRNPLAGRRAAAARSRAPAPGLIGLAERAALAGGRLEHGVTARRVPPLGVAAVAGVSQAIRC